MGKSILFVRDEEVKAKIDMATNIDKYDIRVDIEKNYTILHKNTRDWIGFIIPYRIDLYSGYFFTEITDGILHYAHY